VLLVARHGGEGVHRGRPADEEPLNKLAPLLENISQLTGGLDSLRSHRNIHRAPHQQDHVDERAGRRRALDVVNQIASDLDLGERQVLDEEGQADLAGCVVESDPDSLRNELVQLQRDAVRIGS